MDNKEAIDQLKSLQLYCIKRMVYNNHEPWKSDIEALDLAIKALEERKAYKKVIQKDMQKVIQTGME